MYITLFLFTVCCLRMLTEINSTRNELTPKDSQSDDNNYKCEEDCQIVGAITIVWPRSSPGKILSIPFCLDENFKNLSRQCTGHGWKPKPDCVSVQNDIQHCPDFMREFTEELSFACYFVTNPGPYLSECPSPNSLDYDRYSKILSIMDVPIWVPARRNIRNGLSYMEWDEIHPHNYRQIVPYSITYQDHFSEKNCLVAYKTYNNVTIVDCNLAYSRICYYSPRQFSKNQCVAIGGDISSYTACYVDEVFALPKKCLCLKEATEFKSRNNFCNKLVEFQSSHKIWAMYFSWTGKAWIGLEKIQGLFKWSTSRQPLNYSFWSKNNDLRKQYAVAFDREDQKWTLYDDHEVSSAFCEEEIEIFEEVTLSLSVSQNHLIITIKNPKGLVAIDDSNYTFFCFPSYNFMEYVPKIRNTNDPNIFIWDVEDESPDYYWCEGFKFPNYELVRSDVIFFRTKSGRNEYSVEIDITYEGETDPFSAENLNRFLLNLNQSLQNADILDSVYQVRHLKTLNVNSNNHIIKHLFHITTITYISSISEEEFNWLSEKFKNAVSGVVHFYSCYFCPSEQTDDLTWPLTHPGVTTTPTKICFREDGSPVTRTCMGDFFDGARWSEVHGTCSESTPNSPITDALNEILNSNSTFGEVADQLIELTDNTNKSAVDIYLMAKIFDHFLLMDDDIDLNPFTKIINNIMQTNRSVLSDSQSSLNSTDQILYNIELITKKFNSSEQIIQGQNITFLAADLNATNIVGLALFESTNGIYMEKLYENDSYSDLITSTNLKIAVYLSEQLKQQIINFSLIITVFHNDSLFNEQLTENKTVNQEVISVLIPGFEDDFSAPLLVLFTTPENKTVTCAHWKYGFDSFQPIRGSWMNNSGLIWDNTTLVSVCEYWHVTHLGLLVIGDLDEDDLEDLEKNALALEIITLFGYSLSLIGIMGIFLTGFLFYSWRSNLGNQILMNFAITTLFQVILLYVSSYIYENKVGFGVCVIVGSLLHFTVLSEFCWMFVVGVLQFKKFVQVFTGPPKWLLLKACCIGWLMPLIPVIIVLAVDCTSYGDGNVGLCYPSKLAFYYGVVTPIGIVVVANLFIFIRVLISICSLNAHGSTNVRISQITYGILLFFLLGLTWLFGLLAQLVDFIVFMYLFCLMTPLQGFIMFLFFVVFNKNTRRLYGNAIRINNLSRKSTESTK